MSIFFTFVFTIFVCLAFQVSSKVHEENLSSASRPSHKKVTSLNLSNNNLLRLRKETFDDYDKDLEQLHVMNSKVSIVDDGAFCYLKQLKELNLARNFITSLKSNMFATDNELRKLIIAENNLQDLSNFNVGYFPKLQLFDISSNKMTTLPEHFATVLQKNKNLTIQTDNNPWNCTQLESLGGEIVEKICRDRPTLAALSGRKVSEPSFWNCIFWCAGAMWIGIIVGNIPLLKRILFPSSEPIKKLDQSTQFDYVGEQRRISGDRNKPFMYSSITTDNYTS